MPCLPTEPARAQCVLCRARSVKKNTSLSKNISGNVTAAGVVRKFHDRVQPTQTAGTTHEASSSTPKEIRSYSELVVVRNLDFSISPCILAEAKQKFRGEPESLRSCSGNRIGSPLPQAA